MLLLLLYVPIVVVTCMFLLPLDISVGIDHDKCYYLFWINFGTLARHGDFFLGYNTRFVMFCGCRTSLITVVKKLYLKTNISFLMIKPETKEQSQIPSYSESI